MSSNAGRKKGGKRPRVRSVAPDEAATIKYANDHCDTRSYPKHIMSGEGLEARLLEVANMLALMYGTAQIVNELTKKYACSSRTIYHYITMVRKRWAEENAGKNLDEVIDEIRESAKLNYRTAHIPDEKGKTQMNSANRALEIVMMTYGKKVRDELYNHLQMTSKLSMFETMSDEKLLEVASKLINSQPDAALTRQ